MRLGCTDKFVILSRAFYLFSMTDLILFGMQGSGKGTQGQILATTYGYTIFDTGSQLRRIVTSGSALGQKIQEITNAGKLVPTEVVMEIVADFLSNTPRETPVIFDGIPRSEDQRVLFEKEMEKAGRRPTALYIKLTEDEALARLLGRKTCSGCGKIYGLKDNLAEGAACPTCGGTLKVRADDTDEAIKTRLRVYAEQTVPVIEVYRAEERLIELDGALPVTDVTAVIAMAVQK